MNLVGQLIFVDANSYQSLKTAVQEKLDAGYQPFGSVSPYATSTGIRFIQTMVIYSETTDSYTTTEFVATEDQTEFTIAYSPGYVDVYRNGVKLATSEFTATNGTSITLANACYAGDIISIIAYITG